MKIKNRIKHYYMDIRSDFKYSKETLYKEERMAADIIRKVHSIEKGLSLKNVRLGFGHEKQKDMMKMIELLAKNNHNQYYDEVIAMGVSSICSYIEFHKSKKYSDDFMSVLEEFVSKYKRYQISDYGGVKKIELKDFDFDVYSIEKFFNMRHSIRDFSEEKVDDDTLKKAIKLAQTSPSACNRQGYRVYIFDQEKSSDITQWLSGVGGFAKSINKYMLITAKTSAYKYDENYQYIVSASIFAAYLSLTLHLYKLGVCVIQRPVIWTKSWEKIRKKYCIENDEQVICILGVGNLKDGVNVPISHRLDINNIAKFY